MKDGFTHGFDVPDDQKERHYDVFEEVALLVHQLSKQGILNAISQQVRFARRRFGRYEVIDFVAVLAGLRHQWRTDAGSLLRAPPALGLCLHGPVRS